MTNKKIEAKKVNKKVEEKKSGKGQEQIFRKSSLARLSSPEHLDKLIRVTDSKGWLSLTAAMLLIGLTIVWGFVGELPTKVGAAGILIKSEGVRSIQHSSGGIITDIAIEEGDIVEKGDIVARLASNDLLSRISNSRFELSTLQDGLKRYVDFYQENSIVKREYFERSRSNRKENLNDLNRDIISQKKKIEAQKSLLEKGGISAEELRSSQQILDQLETSRDNAENDLNQIMMEELAYEKQHDDTIVTMSNRISEKLDEIKYLQDQLDEKSKVISPFSGRVVAINIEKDSIVSPGESLALVELGGKEVKNLEGIMFVPAIEAKKIDIWMDVQVAPSTVNSSEYGVMLGKVKKINDYPASPQYIAKILGEELARTYSQMRDPVEMKVDLLPDSETKSGYKWSSRVGPPVEVKTGTPANAQVVVKKQRPITLVFPILSRLLGE